MEVNENIENINDEIAELIFSTNYFSEQMRYRLLEKYEEGYTGWNDYDNSTIDNYANQMYKNCMTAIGVVKTENIDQDKELLKKELIDMANYAMFIYDHIDRLEE